MLRSAILRGYFRGKMEEFAAGINAARPLKATEFLQKEKTHLISLPEIPQSMPVLIAGPTASGKSGLAMQIARRHGGVIVNADASQVYECWRVVTARPSVADEAELPHALYGHVTWDASYSAGHWLRDVTPLLSGPERPIIVGGTGLYFTTLTRGMADIPATPTDIRLRGNDLTLEQLLSGIDATTTAGIDIRNRARVQRAWEVQQATGRSLSAWQADTPPPVLPLEHCVPLVMDAPKAWLNDRIARRFDQMLSDGALEEVAAMRDHHDPTLPAFRAIGVPELMDVVNGAATLDEARERATISTRQFAKRQRTWFRSKMNGWHRIDPTF